MQQSRNRPCIASSSFTYSREDKNTIEKAAPRDHLGDGALTKSKDATTRTGN